MKIKNIKVTIKDRKAVLREFAEAMGKAKGGGEFRQEELSFENVAALRKAITEKRMELLHAIKEERPASIYELAKILKRDLKSVNTDVNVLTEMGLLSLEHSSDERRRVRPRVVFDKLQVEIAI